MFFSRSQRVWLIFAAASVAIAAFLWFRNSQPRLSELPLELETKNGDSARPADRITPTPETRSGKAEGSTAQASPAVSIAPSTNAQTPLARSAIGARDPTLNNTREPARPSKLVGKKLPENSGAAPGVSDPQNASTDRDLIALDKLTLSLRDFRTVMRENPTGTNAEITHALDGGNPRQSRLLPSDARVNGRGELVDRWSTPYFFHQLSKDDMEIRSAGPDKQMWTQDDVVGR